MTVARDARCGTIRGMDPSRIAGFSALSDVPPEELGELAGAMGELEVDAGTSVVTLDDYGTAVYFIEEGQAEVRGEGTGSVGVLGPGDSFGEIGLLLTGQRTASVVASTPMRVVSLSGQDFERIRERVPAVEQALRRLGTERASR
jgi:CRP-like cAMP-binding protein